ncbi:MAG: NAD(P)H-hydrate dehydratase [Caldithrix sp.]|nr:NAD(P)H-hydrate dehydratase [Caldithrix sp.]
MKIARINEMRTLDRSAIENYGIIEEILMENAGQAAYFALLKEFGVRNKTFAVVCGVGNNGGDGLVIARKIHSMGGHARVIILSDPDRFKGAARTNFDIAQKLDLELLLSGKPDDLKSVFEQSDVIIDAIFGTGLDRSVSGKYHTVIEHINASGKPVLALDIPSGINGNTGSVMGIAVQAHMTVTFGLPKLGNVLYPGFDFGGKLFVTHISFPPSLHHSDHLAINVNQPLPLPERPVHGHKGTFGKALFIAGSSNYLGAPYFAAMAYLKAGGGLSFLATPDQVSQFIANKGSEIIMRPQQSTSAGSLAYSNKEALLKFAGECEMVVLGPGVSLDKETTRLSCDLCRELDVPLLVDGDGLTAISVDPDVVRNRQQPTVLTPHPGEMARLTSKTISDIQSDPIESVVQLSRNLNAHIVLKGAHTIIYSPEGQVFINLSGNAGMATAGSGDILTGIIAALFTQGFTFEAAIRNGVFLHGYAGDQAEQTIGEDGMTASDILNTLPGALKLYRVSYSQIVENYYGKIHVL